MLKVDIKNAYNSIVREACLRGVQRYCPQLLRWAVWSLTGPSILYMGEHILLSQTGVQQGDPLAPLLFSRCLHKAIQKSRLAPKSLVQCRQWFLDDGCLKAKYQSQIIHSLGGFLGDLLPFPSLTSSQWGLRCPSSHLPLLKCCHPLISRPRGRGLGVRSMK